MNDSQLGDQREQQAAHGGVHREQRLRLYHQAQFLFSGTVLLLDQTAVGGDYKTGIPALITLVNRSAGHTHIPVSHACGQNNSQPQINSIVCLKIINS